MAAPTDSGVPLLSPAPHQPQGEVSLLRLVAVLLERWKLIAAFTLAAMLIGGILALVQPRTYTARITLVPPTDGNTLPFLGAMSSLPIPGLAARIGGTSNNQQLVETILKSHSLQDSVVSRLRGAAAIDDPRDPIRRTLKKRTSIRSSDTDRSIAVEVTHRDPAVAQQMAGMFPQIMNGIATRVAVHTAIEKRAVLETQIASARIQLEESENRLLAFEQEREVPAVQEQARQAMIAAAELQRAIVEQELAVSRLSRAVTADNPQLQAARAELQARRNQLERLRRGGSSAGILSTGDLPEVKLTASRLMRDFVKDEQVYLSLTASLAEAQVDANQNLAVVTVLDAPRLPVRPSGPKKRLYLAGGAFLGMLIGITLAFVGAYMSRTRTTPDGQSVELAWSHFKGDVSRIVPATRRINGGSKQLSR
jgi:tyrosine-protein kinase Etk/Wzc